MKDIKKSLFKIAILNDLLDLELTEIKVENIIDPVINSKLRNLKKSTNNVTKMMDLILYDPDIQYSFGDYCDKINLAIEQEIKDILI